MLEMQAKQVEDGGPTNEEMEYDDVFILDNVSDTITVYACFNYTKKWWSPHYCAEKWYVLV